MVAPASKKPAPMSSSSSAPSFGIRIDGRTFPRRLRGQKENQLLPSERSRNAKIVARLLDTLPWTQRSQSDFQTKEDMVYGYEDCLKLLDLRHQEVAELLWEVCRTTLSITLKGFEQDDPRRQKIEPLLVRDRFEQAAFPRLQPDGVLTADLLAKPMDEVYQSLHRSVHQTTHRVVQSVFEAMDRLVDHSIFGLIEWTSPGLCKFHFFNETSVYHRKQESSFETNWGVFDEETGLWGIEEIRTDGVEEKESRVRWRHEHHLMSAEKASLTANSVPVPKNIQPMVDKIPEWLSPEAYIVTGVQFSEEVTEQRLKDRVWLKERNKQRKIRTHKDPGIVIDKFVLAGWGEKETREEEARRRDIQAKETREHEVVRFTKSYRSARSLAGWLGGGGTIAIGLGAFGSWAFVLLGIICVGLSLRYTHIALNSAASFYRVVATPAYLTAGIAAMASLWGGWILAMVALSQGAVVAIWIGLGLSMLSGPLLKLTDSWLPGPLFSLPKK